MASITRYKGMASPTGSTLVGMAGDGVLQMDGAITIGLVQVPLNNSYTLTNATLTRNGANDVSINIAASQTAAIDLLLGEYFKEVKSLLSSSSVPPINNSGFLADDSGDTPPNKGTMMTSLVLNWSVQGASLTSFTATLGLNTIGNGVANSINTLINGVNVTPLTVTTNATTCNQATLAIGTPVWDNLIATSPTLELAIVTPGSCTFRLYSVGLIVTYNYL